MKERPILFSGEMVRALLREVDPKMMTRRLFFALVGDRPVYGNGYPRSPRCCAWEGTVDEDGWPIALPLGGKETDFFRVPCPYGVPGDRLWVRETFAPCYFDDGRPAFRADWTDESADLVKPPKWKPAIHMPRALSRIDLEVTAVRVERLQDITEEDAEAEGVESDKGKPEQHYHDTTGVYVGETYPDESYVRGFQSLWSDINGKRAPWASNPWVWVVSFKRVRP